MPLLNACVRLCEGERLWEGEASRRAAARSGSGGASPSRNYARLSRWERLGRLTGYPSAVEQRDHVEDFRTAAGIDGVL